MTYTLDKRFVVAATVEVCESFLFRESTKKVVYIGLYESHLHF